MLKNLSTSRREGVGKAEGSKATANQAGPLDDRELPGSNVPPPTPKPIPGCHDLPPALLPGQPLHHCFAAQGGLPALLGKYRALLQSRTALGICLEP